MNDKLFSSRGIFIMILIALTVSVILFLVFESRPATTPNQVAVKADGQIDSSPIVNVEELTKNYQLEVKNILAGYFTEQGKIALTSDLKPNEKSEWLVLVTNIKNQLLDLKLPGDYRDLHLQLVLNFNAIEEGLVDDFSGVEEAQVKLDGLVAKYPWLK